MKKILFLGGSTQQIPVLKYAKKIDCYSILCDYLEGNPGREYADEFFLVSTTDKDAVLAVASERSVNGIIAYASDPAALTAAYVSKKLGLRSNSLECVKILSKKHLFRQFLRDNNFNSPIIYDYKKIDEYIKNDFIKYPVIVKPVDSSGSKGVMKVNNNEALLEAMIVALDESRDKNIIIEEYIEMDHQYMVGGDAFIEDGEIIFIGCINSHRSKVGNPLVPIGNSYPIVLSEHRNSCIQNELQRAITKIGFEHGPINFELMFDKNDNIYIIEIGPRNGGNKIPEFLRDISGFDMIKLSVEDTIGRTRSSGNRKMNGYYINYVIHSNESGIFKRVIINHEFEKNLYYKVLFISTGDIVEVLDGSNKSLGIVFFRFDKEVDYKRALSVFDYLIDVELEV